MTDKEIENFVNAAMTPERMKLAEAAMEDVGAAPSGSGVDWIEGIRAFLTDLYGKEAETWPARLRKAAEAVRVLERGPLSWDVASVATTIAAALGPLPPVTPVSADLSDEQIQKLYDELTEMQVKPLPLAKIVWRKALRNAGFAPLPPAAVTRTEKHPTCKEFRQAIGDDQGKTMGVPMTDEPLDNWIARTRTPSPPAAPAIGSDEVADLKEQLADALKERNDKAMRNADLVTQVNGLKGQVAKLNQQILDESKKAAAEVAELTKQRDFYEQRAQAAVTELESRPKLVPIEETDEVIQRLIPIAREAWWGKDAPPLSQSGLIDWMLFMRAILAALGRPENSDELAAANKRIAELEQRDEASQRGRDYWKSIAKENEELRVAVAETQIEHNKSWLVANELTAANKRIEKLEQIVANITRDIDEASEDGQLFLANKRIAGLELELIQLRRAAPLCEKHKPTGGARSCCLVCGLEKQSRALSSISYACGEPNDAELSNYDVHCNEGAVVRRVNHKIAELMADNRRLQNGSIPTLTYRRCIFDCTFTNAIAGGQQARGVLR